MRAYMMIVQLRNVLFEAYRQENPLQFLQKCTRNPSLYGEVCEICRVIVRQLT